MVGINYSKEDILESIKKAEADRSYCVLSNFIDRDKLPQWADFINAIYYAAAQDKDEILDSQINKDLEYLIGKLIIQKGIYFNFKVTPEENKQMFPQIQEVIENLPLWLYGPKVSMGPYFVTPHQDRWHAATIQCEGETTWSLKDEKYMSGHVPRFDIDDPNVHRITLKPGDFLYFSQKLLHQIEVDGPRASILFNATGVYDIISE